MDSAELEPILETLHNRVQALDDSESAPRTFFDVVNSSRSESAWQDALAYFLNPDEPHGLGTSVLESFLTLVEDHPSSSFEFYEYDLKDIHVQLEASGDAGRPDIVLWIENTWFLCIELKIDAPETDAQTERYTTASQFGDLTTESIPTAGHHFVYLANRQADDPAADEFVSLTWHEVVSALSSLFDSGIMSYPARSVAQFHDFIRHIRQALHMNTDQGPNPEKVELAFEYSEVINEMADASDEFIQDYQSSWDRQFEQSPPTGWTDEWTTIRYGSKWGRLMKKDWMLPQNEDGEPKKTKGFSIAVSIDIKLEDFQRGETEAVFSVYGDNEYTERYLNRLHSGTGRKDIETRLEGTQLTANRSSGSKPIKSIHPFDFDDGKGHLGALRDLFVEYNNISTYIEEPYFDIRSEIGNPNQLFD